MREREKCTKMVTDDGRSRRQCRRAAQRGADLCNRHLKGSRRVLSKSRVVDTDAALLVRAHKRAARAARRLHEKAAAGVESARRRAG